MVTVVAQEGATASVTVPITVTNALTPTAETVDLGQLTQGNYVEVGQVQAADPAAVSSDFSVSTDWGDDNGATSGFVVPADATNDGTFIVYAAYDDTTVYAGSTNPITVTVTENTGQTGSATATIYDTSLTLDDGSTVSVSSLYSGADLTIDGGSTMNVGADPTDHDGSNANSGADLSAEVGSTADSGGNSFTLHSLSLVDGTIAETGTITSNNISLQNGEVDADLAGQVNFTGDGYAALLGNNSLTSTLVGGTGTLAVGSGGLGGTVTFASPGTLQALGNFSLSSITTSDNTPATIDTAGNTVAVTGSVSGPGDLVKTDDGTLDLSAAATSGLSANIDVQGGFIAAGGMDNLGSGTSALIFDGGGLQWTAPFDIAASKPIAVCSGGATFDTNGFNVTILSTLGNTSVESDGAAGGISVIDSSGGNGLLTLAPAAGGNIYENGTTIDGPTAAGADAAFGSCPINFGASGLLKAINTLVLTQTVNTPDDPSASGTIDSDGNSVTLDEPVAGGGGLTAIDTSGNGGSLTFAAANSFSGVAMVGSATETFVISNAAALQNAVFDTSGPGTLSFDSSLASATFGGLQGSDDFTLPAGFTLNLGGCGFATTFSGNLIGSGTIIVNGPAMQVLAGSDNSGFSGLIAVGNGATLEAATPAAMPASVTAQCGGTLAFGADGADAWTAAQIAAKLTSSCFPAGGNVGIDTGNATFTYNQPPSDIGSYPLGLVVLGDGTLVLAQSNTYSGGTTVPGGTLKLTNVNALPSGGDADLENGGTLDGGGNSIAVGGLTLNGNLVDGTFTATSLTASDAYVSASITTPTTAIADGGYFSIGGSGTNSLGNVTIGSGATFTIGDGSGATVATSGNMDVPAGTTFVVTSGDTWNADGDASVEGTAEIDGTANVSDMLTWDTAGKAVGVPGTIAGGGMTFTDSVGGGGVTLSGANTYTGPTIVNGCTLVVANASALPDGTSLAVGDSGAFSNLALLQGGTTQGMPVNSSAPSSNAQANRVSTAACNAVLDAEAQILSPSSTGYSDLTTAQQMDAIGIFLDVASPVMASSSAMNQASVDATLASVWAAHGNTVTANNNTFKGGIENTYNDPWVTYLNWQLAWYATNDVSFTTNNAASAANLNAVTLPSGASLTAADVASIDPSQLLTEVQQADQQLTQTTPTAPATGQTANTVQRIDAVTRAVINYESQALYGVANINSLTGQQQMNVCGGVDLNTIMDVIAANGGTRQGSTEAEYDAAMTAVWTGYGRTVTPNNKTFDGGEANPSDNAAIQFRNWELAWYETHDVN